MKGRKCQLGKPCGNTCISPSKKCSAKLSSSHSALLAKAKESLRRGQGQSLDGESLDYPKLKERVDKWMKDNNLKVSEEVGLGHDEIHVLTRDYLGKTGKALGSLIGEPSTGGPTNFEEVLVEVFGRMSMAGNPGENFIRNWARQTYELSEDLGTLPKSHLFRRNPQRAVDLSLRYINSISSREDFSKFLETLKSARTKAYQHFQNQSSY